MIKIITNGKMHQVLKGLRKAKQISKKGRDEFVLQLFE